MSCLQLPLFQLAWIKEIQIYDKSDPGTIRYRYFVKDSNNSPQIEKQYYHIHHRFSIGDKRELHNENGPALLVYDRNGELLQERYYDNGVLHRADGPAHIQYRQGIICSEEYYLHGVRHRVDGPSFRQVFSDGDVVECYLQNGRFYRKDGPARIHTAADGTITSAFYSQGLIKNIFFNFARNAVLIRTKRRLNS